MRFDPEDYAFIAHYDPSRLTDQAKGLGKQGLARLFSLVISVVFVFIIARSADKHHPSLWQPATRWAGICVIVACLVLVVVLLVARASTGKGGAARQVGLLVGLLAGSGGLAWPAWLLTRQFAGYADSVNLLVTAINLQPDQPGLAAAQRFHTQVVAAHWTLLVALGLVAAAMLLGLVLLAVWLGRPRSLGWGVRREIDLAAMGPPGLFIVCGAGLLLFAKMLAPQTNKQLSPPDMPSDNAVPPLAVFDDWLIWLLLAGMMITVAMLASRVAKLICANLLLQRVPAGNALRVDALGLVTDTPTGPRRVAWNTDPVITARQHQDLPGHELVIRSPRRPAWTVPFLYLDVLPGTIDSAIRAATLDVRTLNVKPLDKAF